ncbi:BsaA family SipW-dependent biofilm matrix protein [Breznakia pachnodae]|uniref:Alternate signal-mediated exported protein n=1 Tax=Breznakia pachnodae TaxID=265178 RepID=A0ABU0DXL6_9FIRM|nr:BsaA family SipW-dependent biofilm matrix protein [Breznakia pachnodae]MDQ0359379.1 hypothetical protein [Breznakia pachnodae]
MKEKKKLNKKKVTLVTSLVVLVLLISSTLLWFTAKDTVPNIFNMDTFDVEVTEKFNPKTPVTPGLDVDKKVGVTNKGESDAVVRVRLEKELILMTMDGDENIEIFYKTDQTIADGDIMVKISARQIEDYIASGFVEDTGNLSGLPTGVKVYKRVQNKPDNSGELVEYFGYVESNNRLIKYDPDTKAVTYAYYKQDTTGGVKKGYNEKVNTPPEAMDDFTHTGIDLVFDNDKATNWPVDPETGWYYYSKELPGKGVTPLLLDHVSFADTLDNTYKGATFKITVHMEAIQAENGAVATAGWPVTLDGNGNVTLVP